MISKFVQFKRLIVHVNFLSFLYSMSPKKLISWFISDARNFTIEYFSFDIQFWLMFSARNRISKGITSRRASNAMSQSKWHRCWLGCKFNLYIHSKALIVLLPNDRLVKRRQISKLLIFLLLQNILKFSCPNMKCAINHIFFSIIFS